MGGAPPYGYDLAYESQTGQCLFYLRYMPDGSKQMFNEKWKLIRTLQRGESSLDSTLHHGSLDQRRTALRRCVEGVVIDHPNKRAELKLRVLPIGVDSHTTAGTKTVVVKLLEKRPGRKRSGMDKSETQR